MPNRKSLLYTADDGVSFGCVNISANNVKLGFAEDLTELKKALPRPKTLKFRGVYATATSTGGVMVTRFYPAGTLDTGIYKTGGTIKQQVTIQGMSEELEFTVTSARGESRQYLTIPDPGGPAPVPTVTLED